MTIHIGTSGWSYAHWDGVLYPHGSAPRERLGYYTQRFQTVEVNSTYYRWPADATFAHWRRRLAPPFRLTVKAPRGLSHGARLYAPEAWIARIERSLGLLGDTLGVLLVQLPPDMACDHARLRYFLQRLPPGLRVAMELRHASWHTQAVFDLLERHGAAYCVMSGAQLPCVLRATAAFVYARLHGPDTQHMYAGSYSDADLHWWAERLREWEAQGREVFVYFNNDGDGNAVRNALTLRAIVGR
ncbi:DUF72 domain-containing protein [Chloroflexia bacterium SDU3-3]|nr:DUF72 domain-containing protein [Chloroflexia bacterium SDU3-3]